MSEAAIRLHIEPLEEGGYLATSPDVPGLVAEGRSIVEAVEIAQRNPKVAPHLAGKIVKKVIFVPGRILNLVVE